MTDVAQNILLAHDNHGCNLYCRDGNHAEIVWVEHADPAIAEMSCNFWFSGIEIVDIRPAHEVPPDPDGVLWNPMTGEHDVRTSHTFGFLMIFREAS